MEKTSTLSLEKFDGIDIDDNIEVEKIINEYRDFSDNITNEIEELKNVVSDENLEILQEVMLEELGISSINSGIEDVDGGNVQTVHNYEKGILAPGIEKDKYDRNKFDSQRAKTTYREQRKEKEKYYSDFSGKIQEEQKNPEKQLQVEHCVAIKSAYDKYGFLGDEKIKDNINSEDNFVLLTDSENASKNSHSYEEWKNKEINGIKNSERFQENKDYSKSIDEKIKKTESKFKKEVGKKYAKDVTKESAKEFSKIAGKDIITRVLIECNKEFIVYLKYNIKPSLGFSDLLKLLCESFKNAIRKIFENIKKIILSSLKTGLSGIIETVVITLINTVCSLAKEIISIIRKISRRISRMKSKYENIKSTDSKLRKKEILSIVMAGLMTIPIFGSLNIIDGIEKILLSVGIPNGISDVLAIGISTLLGSTLIILIGNFINRLKQNNIKKLEIMNSQLKTGIAAAEALTLQMELERYKKEIIKFMKEEEKLREKYFQEINESLENSTDLISMIDSISLNLVEDDEIEELMAEYKKIKREKINKLKILKSSL